MIQAVSLLMSPNKEDADLIQKIANEYNIYDFETVAGKDLGLKKAISVQSLFNGIECSPFFSDDKTSDHYASILIDRINDLYKSLECKNFVFGSPKFRNVFSEKEFYRSEKFFHDVCENIPKDAVLALENNPSEYGTNYATSFAQCLDIVNTINHPKLKINFDIGGYFKTNDDIYIIIRNIEHVNHIHVSRFNLLPISELSKEEVYKYRELVTSLKEVYDGTISLETNIKNNLTNDLIRKEIVTFKEICE